MSSGQFHYQEAERLMNPEAMESMALKTLADASVELAYHNMDIAVATAQVHATLALAAATIEQANRADAQANWGGVLEG